LLEFRFEVVKEEEESSLHFAINQRMNEWKMVIPMFEVRQRSCWNGNGNGIVLVVGGSRPN
jgi:hypothetical protein